MIKIEQKYLGVAEWRTDGKKRLEKTDNQISQILRRSGERQML